MAKNLMAIRSGCEADGTALQFTRQQTMRSERLPTRGSRPASWSFSTSPEPTCLRRLTCSRETAHAAQAGCQLLRAAGRQRHPYGAGLAGPRRCGHHDELHARIEGWRRRCGAESARLAAVCNRPMKRRQVRWSTVCVGHFSRMRDSIACHEVAKASTPSRCSRSASAVSSTPSRRNSSSTALA